jgi:hypothetical protein
VNFPFLKTFCFLFLGSISSQAASEIEELKRKQRKLLQLVENKPGALQVVTDKLAEASVDLTLIYGSVDKNAEMCKIVMITKDNLSAMMVIKSEFGRQ